MELNIANNLALDIACKRFHYAKLVPNVSLAYNVFNGQGEWCGIIAFGVGANPQIAKPYDKWQGQVVELVRVAFNGKQESTSKALALSLKLLKKDAPLVDMVVSYADADEEHTGTIYQATNWIYAGLMNKNTMSAMYVKGRKMHMKTIMDKGWKANVEWLRLNVDKYAREHISQGKHKYLYPMDKKMRKLVEPLAQPYPKKGEGSPDKSALQPLPRKEEVRARLRDLGPRLLKAEYKAQWSEDNPCWGYCYLVSEAIHHYCREETVPRCFDLGEGYGKHWFLDKNGEPVDYTAEQFDFKVPHHRASKRQFRKGSVETERGLISKRGYEMARWLGLV